MRTTYLLYVVYDIISEELFGNIIRANNHEVARRSFRDALAAKDTPVGQHPADYNLLCIGTLDSHGNIGGVNELGEPTSANEHFAFTIMTGADWLKEQENK